MSGVPDNTAELCGRWTPWRWAGLAMLLESAAIRFAILRKFHVFSGWPWLTRCAYDAFCDPSILTLLTEELSGAALAREEQGDEIFCRSNVIEQNTAVQWMAVGSGAQNNRVATGVWAVRR